MSVRPSACFCTCRHSQIQRFHEAKGAKGLRVRLSVSLDHALLVGSLAPLSVLPAAKNARTTTFAGVQRPSEGASAESAGMGTKPAMAGLVSPFTGRFERRNTRESSAR